MRRKYVQDSINKYISGEINAEEHSKNLANIGYYYDDLAKVYDKMCNRDIRELNYVLVAYKENNDMPVNRWGYIDFKPIPDPASDYDFW